MGKTRDLRRTTEADKVCPCTMYDVRRRHLAVPMYDVRRTMYDLGNSRALRGDAERVRTGCPRAVIGRSYKAAGGGGAWRRLCTTEADKVCLCTMYDVRCTIAIIARFARGGGGENADYVRCTIWKFGEPPARGILRSVGGGGWEEQSAGVIRKVSNFAEPFSRLCYLVHRQPHFLMRLPCG